VRYACLFVTGRLAWSDDL